MRKLGYFKFFKEMYEFEIIINTFGYNINILGKETKIPIEVFLQNSELSAFKNLIYECYIKGEMDNIITEYINYNIPNIEFIRNYGLISIVIERNVDNIHKIVELRYEVNTDNVKISAIVISKLYNVANNVFDYSVYYIDDFLTLPLIIDNVISTISLVGKLIKIENYIYDIISDTNESNFTNLNFEETYNNLQLLNLCTIENDQLKVNYRVDALYDNFNEMLGFDMSDNIKDQILLENSKLELDDYITKIF